MKIISYLIACMIVAACSISFGMTITEELILGKNYSIESITQEHDWVEITPQRTHHRLFKRVTQQADLEFADYIEYDEAGEITNIDHNERYFTPTPRTNCHKANYNEHG